MTEIKRFIVAKVLEVPFPSKSLTEIDVNSNDSAWVKREYSLMTLLGLLKIFKVTTYITECELTHNVSFGTLVHSLYNLKSSIELKQFR